MRAACPKDKLEFQLLQALLFVRKFIKLQVFPCVRSPARPRKTRVKAQPRGQGHGWPWDKKIHRKKRERKRIGRSWDQQASLPKPGLKARLTLAISQSLSKPRDKKSGVSGTSRPARIGQNRAKARPKRRGDPGHPPATEPG